MLPEHLERLRASYAIAFEKILDRLTDTLLRYPAIGLNEADLRLRLHGILAGTIAFALQPGPECQVMTEVGGNVCSFCDGSREALAEFRMTLADELIAALPEADREHMRSAIELVLTHLTYGYVLRANELDIPATAQSLNEPVAMDNPYRRAFEQSPRGMNLMDADTGDFAAFNDGMISLFGFTLDEERRLGPEEVRNEETPEDDFDLLADLFAGKIPWIERESARPHKDGRSIRFHLLAWPVRDDSGKLIYVANILTPLHANEQLNTRWGMGEKRIRYLSRLSSDPIIVVSDVGVIRYSSPSVEPVLGYDPDEVVGRQMADLVLDADRPVIAQLTADALAGARRSAKSEVRIVRKDGEARWFEVVASNLSDVPEIGGIALQARDISERKLLESRLEGLALIDPLTMVLNRRGFLRRLDTMLDALAVGDRTPRLFYIDLDYFKTINDRLGHPAGDEVLVQTAAALAARVGDRGFVGRMGGDEFVLALEDGKEEVAEAFARELTATLEQPCIIDGMPIAVGGSFGISEEKCVPTTAADLLLSADRALFVSKAERRRGGSAASSSTL